MAEVKQGTVEWMAEREGKITSSRISCIMPEPKSADEKALTGLSVGAKSYAYEIIANSLVSMPSFHNEATDWGNNAESLARHFYAQRTGYYVDEVGFIESDIQGYGGSPDGIIYTNMGSDIGIVEFKCPFNSGIHIKYCLIKCDNDIPNEYYWQCQSNMYVAGAAWCDFVSFDPRIDSDMGLFIYRLYRNNSDIERMIKQVKNMKTFISNVKSQLGIK